MSFYSLLDSCIIFIALVPLFLSCKTVLVLDLKVRALIMILVGLIPILNVNTKGNRWYSNDVCVFSEEREGVLISLEFGQQQQFHNHFSYDQYLAHRHVSRVSIHRSLSSRHGILPTFLQERKTDIVRYEEKRITVSWTSEEPLKLTSVCIKQRSQWFS